MHRRQAWPYNIKTPPAGDPLFVTVANARIYLRTTIEQISDSELTAFIKASQAAIERFTKLTLFTTVFTSKRDWFDLEIRLHQAPLIDVTQITRLVSNVPVDVAANVYKAIDTAELNWGSIVLKADQIWPTDMDNERRAIEITFSAGFGPDSSSLPADLIQGGLRLLADLLENRGDCGCSCEGALSAMTAEARALLQQFRILEV